MQSMFQPPSDSVINSIGAVNKDNINKLKRYLRECKGMKDMLISSIIIIFSEMLILF